MWILSEASYNGPVAHPATAVKTVKKCKKIITINSVQRLPLWKKDKGKVLTGLQRLWGSVSYVGFTGICCIIIFIYYAYFINSILYLIFNKRKKTCLVVAVCLTDPVQDAGCPAVSHCWLSLAQARPEFRGWKETQGARGPQRVYCLLAGPTVTAADTRLHLLSWLAQWTQPRCRSDAAALLGEICKCLHHKVAGDHESTWGKPEPQLWHKSCSHCV